MAVPKKKKSRMRRDRRRAQHDKVKIRGVAVCPSCGAPMIPHRACPACGMYKGRQVIAFEDEEGGPGSES